MEDLVVWLADAQRWSGSDSIPTRVYEHVVLSGAALLAALAIAVPLGAYIGHTGRWKLLAVTIANVGRAMPTLALLVIFLPLILRAGLGLGFWPTFVPLVLLAIPPILVNTYVGIGEVDAEVREAARGLGMKGSQQLLRVELPLALPPIATGLRTAAVQVIATATLGALVASGGLGRYVIDGIALQDTPRLVIGAVLVAGLALGVDALLSFVARPGRRRQVPGGTSQGVAPVT